MIERKRGKEENVNSICSIHSRASCQNGYRRESLDIKKVERFRATVEGKKKEREKKKEAKRGEGEKRSLSFTLALISEEGYRKEGKKKKKKHQTNRHEEIEAIAKKKKENKGSRKKKKAHSENCLDKRES